MSKKDIHVVPRDGGWAVRREHAERDSSHHDRKSDAMNAARDTARRERVEVVDHGRDGKIRDSDSYGNDPNPPKDKEH
jgi:hypothetical protein